MEYVEDIKLSDSRRVLVGAGARALFYPTLVYNLVRNKLQAEFRWWDQIQEFLLLGAVPFPSDVKRLKDLGVRGVITLNEPYETLVPTSLYKAHGIDHLVLPTRDYLFAPSIDDICQAVNFIHGKTLLKQATYVHCKAGRGRSTTIVICYLVQHRHMSPDVAYAFVRSIRPRVLLASAQRQAVQEYYHLKVKKSQISSNIWSGSTRILRPLRLFPYADVFTFDDGSVVVITKADVDGYKDERHGSDMSLVFRVSKTALATFSRLWVSSKMSGVRLVNWNKCSKASDEMSINIHLC
ncbi:putative dual specificity protein phosphatase DSP8 isoform X1 [Cynara cardunculus var. scolymus]|uniref:phosphatidylglycerophosphatase n=1 Tax=Cynara cardunculus var. scolymus TaxID=59895 RepID=A0A118JWN6_CYNCS|nr:putative dual specificity protein phosphatase DSP8 isoform X1 [Cynara cardunculus var. scolymus]KVH95531.1 Dual specificity phosphatase [Cynara cardunculus var. scolymus]